MSQAIDVNGKVIQYPETGDPNWGDEATDFAVQTSAAFGKLGLASGTSVDIAGTLGIANGTASNPSLAPSGDTNTGLYSIGSDKLGFAANGARIGEFGVGYGGFTGNIIQIQSTSKTNKFDTTSNNYTPVTGLNVSIIPKYASSKIYILVMVYANMSSSTTACLRIDRSGTSIFENTGSAESGYVNFNTSASPQHPIYYGINGMDSPNTTSSITYTLQVKVGAGTVYISSNSSNYYGCFSSITAMELQQ